MSLQDTLEQLNNLDLNDIDWSRVGVWPFLSRLFVWCLAIAAVFALVYFLIIKDLQKSLSQEISKENDLRSNFQGKVYQASSLEQYRLQMQTMEKDFEFLLGQLPRKTQVPGLLDDIDERGRLSGLDISSIKLQVEQKGEFYVTLPIDIAVTGSYHELGSFVSGIAGMSRIVTLHDFSISAKESPSELSMTIRANTYRSVDEGDSR